MVLAAVLSSPDVKSETVQSWATADPVDFVTTATGELTRSTLSAGYGAPYNGGSGSVQGIGPISPSPGSASTSNDFVLAPLAIASAGSADLASARDTYDKADDRTPQAWLDS